MNDGKGFFTDITETHLPNDDNRCFRVAFLDIDDDGNADIMTGNTNGSRFGGETPFNIYLNDGKGKFSDATGPSFQKALKEEVSILIL
ncbi:VCBS repeat-containing protein [Roseivirga sp. E12]|uniref:VCBS repeat-containing protein n=1 Tax=Roseivirga sp. E12 TaxID=2819237 RepID=UPI001ABC8301|nr:VCBS repeat-containing protein [Roseivirga sp. E12]MBO3697287.1 VCBS repeat-containing protein [Roseivirga sp. E12]